MKQPQGAYQASMNDADSNPCVLLVQDHGVDCLTQGATTKGRRTACRSCGTPCLDHRALRLLVSPALPALRGLRRIDAAQSFRTTIRQVRFVREGPHSSLIAPASTSSMRRTWNPFQFSITSGSDGRGPLRENPVDWKTAIPPRRSARRNTGGHGRSWGRMPL